MCKPAHITILGGGLAGLAVGYYAKKVRLPYTIYEASNRIGGNSITLKHGDFFFDLGAHRFHDKDAEVTKEVKKLLGEDLKEINAPSQIYHNEKFIDFPLSPLNLMEKLGLFMFFKAGVEVIGSRLSKRKPEMNFESFALHTYGRTIAELFLLNQSEKLWGTPCDKLSLNIGGTRLKGLSLKTFIKEALFGRIAKTKHLEGSFYYPKMGIGTIAEKMCEFCGEENILRNSKITKILHNHTRINAIEVNGKERIDVDEVTSTLPLGLFLQIMEPVPPEEILLLAKDLRFRNLRLVNIFLDRDAVIKEVATVYFPSSDFPFTRISEPRNRSIYMSPVGKTSLIVEIPCQHGDKIWSLEDDKLIHLVSSKLIQISLIREEEIIDATATRLNYAYPILEIDFEEKIQKVNTFLKSFSNLTLSGRNGKFMYAWIHNMIKFGKEIVDQYITKNNVESFEPD